MQQFHNYLLISLFTLQQFRSSHPRCSVKKGALRNFAKFSGKHLCQSLFFYKVAGIRPSTLFIKKLWHSCFPVNFAKFLGTPFLQNTSRRLLPISCMGVTCTKLKHISRTILRKFFLIKGRTK